MGDSVIQEQNESKFECASKINENGKFIVTIKELRSLSSITINTIINKNGELE
jgi:hypothetical protein